MIGLAALEWPSLVRRSWFISIRCRRLMAVLATTVLIGISPTGNAQPLETSGVAPDLPALFAGLGSSDLARSLPEAALEALSDGRDRLDPQWPLTTFLLAEIEALHGNPAGSVDLHRELALWAAEDPYGDGWGGSGLAIVSLWRWQQALAAREDPAPARLLEAIEAGDVLLGRRLTERMFSNAIFDALPQLDDAVRRLRPKLTWKAGDRRRALRQFVDYMRAAGAAEMDAEEEMLLEKASSTELVSRDWLLLLRGQRLMKLNMQERARALLQQAFESDNPDVRAEAGLALAEAIRATESRPLPLQEEVITKVIEKSADPRMIQRALLERGYLYKRAGRTPSMLADFGRLVESYPAGPFTDDALVEIARHYQNIGDLDRALEYFTRLQKFPGDNDWADTAVYQPAIALYTRGEQGDLERAYSMLQEYERNSVAGPVRRVALFWLGRIAEQLDQPVDAEGWFRLTIAEMPYDYYAVRARMHLNVGGQAKTLVETDPETHAGLARDFAASYIDDTLKGRSPYMKRLVAARRSELYAEALAARGRFRMSFPGRRVEEIPLSDLDAKNVLGSLAVLMALRQDASAAKDSRAGARRRLNVAGALIRMGDVPYAIHLATGVGERYEWRSEAQQNERFLATAYPLVFADGFRTAARRHRLVPEFLYGVARQESSFDSFAVSPRGAIGLFQFTSSAFDEMNPDNALLKAAGVATRREFLTDASLSIDLGAEWFEKRKLPSVEGNLLLAIMAHHAGNTAVRRWKRDWDAIGRGDDIEFMVETARSRATRYLARRVVADYAIAGAAKFLDRD